MESIETLVPIYKRRRCLKVKPRERAFKQFKSLVLSVLKLCKRRNFTMHVGVAGERNLNKINTTMNFYNSKAQHLELIDGTERYIAHVTGPQIVSLCCHYGFVSSYFVVSTRDRRCL